MFYFDLTIKKMKPVDKYKVIESIYCVLHSIMRREEINIGILPFKKIMKNEKIVKMVCQRKMLSDGVRLFATKEILEKIEKSLACDFVFISYIKKCKQDTEFINVRKLPNHTTPSFFKRVIARQNISDEKDIELLKTKRRQTLKTLFTKFNFTYTKYNDGEKILFPIFFDITKELTETTPRVKTDTFGGCIVPKLDLQFF